MLRTHVIGVGDAFTERYHNASLVLEDPASGERVLVDCPPAIPRVLADHRQRTGSDVAVGNIDHVLLTHLHGDHCGGTEAFLFLRRFVFGRKPTLHGAPEVLDPLWPTRLAGGMASLLVSLPPEEQVRTLTLGDYCERQDLAPGVSRVGPFLIERRFTIHHIPTTALRVSLPGRPRPLLGYSADTAFDPSLIAWLAEADVLIHETNYGVHTPLAQLAALPAELRARMRLIHYPDQLEVDSAPISCLREGQILEIG